MILAKKFYFWVNVWASTVLNKFHMLRYVLGKYKTLLLKPSSEAWVLILGLLAHPYGPSKTVRQRLHAETLQILFLYLIFDTDAFAVWFH